jgi:hypothetical protein
MPVNGTARTINANARNQPVIGFSTRIDVPLQFPKFGKNVANELVPFVYRNYDLRPDDEAFGVEDYSEDWVIGIL